MHRPLPQVVSWRVSPVSRSRSLRSAPFWSFASAYTILPPSRPTSYEMTPRLLFVSWRADDGSPGSTAHTFLVDPSTGARYETREPRTVNENCRGWRSSRPASLRAPGSTVTAY